jgi:predicted O-linked N-acetylglucosamine transferase (SPINDLY family)
MANVFARGFVPSSGLAGASHTIDRHKPDGLNDGTAEPWGSTETDEDTYFYLTRTAPFAPRLASLVLFSPGGRAHLRDVSVVAGRMSNGQVGDWTVIRARPAGGTHYEERITIDPLPDFSIVDIEIEPDALDAGGFDTIGFACFSRSRGYRRNWLPEGRGIYVRELVFDRDPHRSIFGVGALSDLSQSLWPLLEIEEPLQRFLETTARLTSEQLSAIARECLATGAAVGEVYRRIGEHLFRYAEPELSAFFLRRALERNHRRDVHSAYLQSIYLDPAADNARIFAEAVEYHRRCHAGTAPIGHGSSSYDPDRRIQVGMVCNFFQGPGTDVLLIRALRDVDRRKLELVLYNDGEPDGDAPTDGPIIRAHHTRDLGDERLAELIKKDRIDVLFELNGHLPGARYGALAYRPAPVQINWYNWWATTGLPFIDYMVDPCDLVLAEEEPFYVERILRAPFSLSFFAVPSDAPPLAPPPVCERGRVTLGCFGANHKLNDALLDAWARLLRRNPTFDLMLKNAALGETGFQERIRRFFASRGVPASRLILRGFSDFRTMLGEYREVDIALDTWPHNGGGTTFSALCQGVPVVTWRGNRPNARTGAMLLSGLGLERLIASNAEHLAEIVETLAADVEGLKRMRGELRGVLASSNYISAENWAWNFEAIVRSAWHDRCRREQARGAT